jgi:hypothetical protein
MSFLLYCYNAIRVSRAATTTATAMMVATRAVMMMTLTVVATIVVVFFHFYSVGGSVCVMFFVFGLGLYSFDNVVTDETYHDIFRNIHHYFGDNRRHW